MPEGYEFQTQAAATLKPREAKVVLCSAQLQQKAKAEAFLVSQ